MATMSRACRLLPVVGSYSRTLLWTYKLLSSIKPLMALSLTLRSFFGLESGQGWALQACGVQPNNCPSSQETKETPVSPRYWEIRTGNGKFWRPSSSMWNPKVTGGIPGRLSTSMWGPVVVSLMNEGCQESTENSDIPKAVAEILTSIKVGKKK